jgi:hypothetical protein
MDIQRPSFVAERWIWNDGSSKDSWPVSLLILQRFRPHFSMLSGDEHQNAKYQGLFCFLEVIVPINFLLWTCFRNSSLPPCSFCLPEMIVWTKSTF